MKKMLSVLIAVAACAMSMAQVPSTEPPAELKKLDYMVGEWTASGPFTMMGMEMTMTMKVKITWDGQFLRQEVVNEIPDVMTMTETLMLGWDAKKSEYLSHSYTNMSASPRVEHGKLDGDKLVMTSDPWDIMGEESINRTTTWKSGDDIVIVMEFKQGDDWAKAGEWTLKKKK